MKNHIKYITISILLLFSCNNKKAEQHDENWSGKGIRDYYMATHNSFLLEEKNGASVRLIRYSAYGGIGEYFYSIDNFSKEMVVEKKIHHREKDKKEVYSAKGYHCKPLDRERWNIKINSILKELNRCDWGDGEGNLYQVEIFN